MTMVSKLCLWRSMLFLSPLARCMSGTFPKVGQSTAGQYCLMQWVRSGWQLQPSHAAHTLGIAIALQLCCHDSRWVPWHQEDHASATVASVCTSDPNHMVAAGHLFFWLGHAPLHILPDTLPSDMSLTCLGL